MYSHSCALTLFIEGVARLTPRVQIQSLKDRLDAEQQAVRELMANNNKLAAKSSEGWAGRLGLSGRAMFLAKAQNTRAGSPSPSTLAHTHVLHCSWIQTPLKSVES